DELVGVQDVAADGVAAEAYADAAALAGDLRLALLHRLLGQARAQDLQRRVLVRRLAALVLDGDDDVRRQVRDPHGGVGLVHVLPARARGAGGGDAQVVVVALD